MREIRIGEFSEVAPEFAGKGPILLGLSQQVLWVATAHLVALSLALWNSCVLSARTTYLESRGWRFSHTPDFILPGLEYYRSPLRNSPLLNMIFPPIHAQARGSRDIPRELRVFTDAVQVKGLLITDPIEHTTDDDLRQLAVLDRLRSLSITGGFNKQISLASYSFLPKNLTHLTILDCNLHGVKMKPLRALQNLKSLTLGRCALKDEDFDDFSSLSGLEVLDLFGNELTGTFLNKLTSDFQLHWLSLGLNPDFEEGNLSLLRNQKRLKVLFLGGIRLTDRGLVLVGNVKNLAKLSVRDTDISFEGVVRFIQAANNLRVLELSPSRIIGVREIQRLREAFPAVAIE